MNRTLLVLSIAISTVLTIVLWNSCPSVVKLVDRLIYLYDFSIPEWILIHVIFALSFGLIPLWAYLIWRYGKFTHYFSLVAHSLFIYTISLLTSGYIFLNFSEYTDQINQSGYLPHVHLDEPHWGEYTMNFAIPFSVFIPLLLLLIIAAFQRKRRKFDEPEELDHSALN